MKTVEVVAAVLMENDKVLATQRGYGVLKGFWEFPGGKIEPGEDHMEALRREIEEELNVALHISDFLCTVEYSYPSFELIMHCYVCTIREGSIRLHEHMAANWLPREQLRDVDWLPADIAVVKALEEWLLMR